MQEPDRKIAKDWKEYLSQMRESAGVYRWVMREFMSKESWTLTRRLLGLTLLGMGLSSVQPYLVGHVFNGLIAREHDLIVASLCIIAAMLLAQKVFDWAAMHFRELLLGVNMGRMDHRTSELFFEKSMGQHLSEHNTLSASTLENARGRIWGLQSMLLFESVPALVHLSVAYTLLWWMHWVAGSLATTIVVLHVCMTVFLNQRAVAVSEPIEREFRARDRYRSERWYGIERVKTNARECDELVHLDAWFAKLIAEDRRLWLWFLRMIGRRDLVSSCVVFGIFVFGAREVMAGRMEAGMLYPLFVWSSAVRDDLWRIGHVELSLNHNLAAVQSMKAALTLLSDVEDAPDAVDLPEGQVRVELRGLSFAYPVTEREEAPPHQMASGVPVLKEVDLTIEHGEKVALMGLSGAGKTTIMRHVLRYMDPQTGAVFVNGVNLRYIRQGSWLSAIAYVPQEAHVFDGSLRDNLLYGLRPQDRERVTDEELWVLVRKMQLDLGPRLTQGLHTRVGRRGLRLSGGEQQRVMIAAAALRRPRFMVIDEATSNLDSMTELEVQKGIASVLGSNIGALIITHRLSTVQNLCTKFVMLRSAASVNGRGQVEAVASSFEALARQSQTFRLLAQQQGIQFTWCE